MHLKLAWHKNVLKEHEDAVHMVGKLPDQTNFLPRFSAGSKIRIADQFLQAFGLSRPVLHVWHSLPEILDLHLRQHDRHQTLNQLVANGQDLPWWHPLISGSPDTVHEAGISVKGKVAESEVNVPDKDLVDYIVKWPMKWPKGSKGKSRKS